MKLQTIDFQKNHLTDLHLSMLDNHFNAIKLDNHLFDYICKGVKVEPLLAKRGLQQVREGNCPFDEYTAYLKQDVCKWKVN